jgi:transposase
MALTSNFRQVPAPEAGQALSEPIEILGVTSCGRAALWLGLLRRMDLRGIVDRWLPSQSDVSHGEVVEALVLNRLTSPRPLYQIEEWARQLGLDVLTGRDPARLNDDRIGRTLDVLADRVPHVQAALTTQIVHGFGVAVTDVHYDTSTLVLEGDYSESELAAHGHSKDRKPDHKQVKLALVSSADGQVPLTHVTLPGNTGDVTTVPTALIELRRQLVTQPVVISGDAAMWSQANMDAVARAGGVFLGPIAMIPTVAAWVCTAKPDVEVTVQLTRAHKAATYSATVVGRFAVDGVADAGAHIVVYDPRRAAHEVAEREAALIRYEVALNKLVAGLNRRTLKTRAAVDKTVARLATRHGLAARYIPVAVTGIDGACALTWTRDETLLAAAPARDGKWPLVTNQSGLDDAALCAWAVQRYKTHGHIERDMHLIKGPLRVRPLFVQNDERIRALVAISVWALQALTLLERAGRRILPPAKSTLPVRIRLETLLAAVAIVTYRTAPEGPIRRTSSPPPPAVLRMLRDLGWLPDIRRLLTAGNDVTVPS